MRLSLFLVILCYQLSPLYLRGQDTLYLTNPSFEDQPQHSHTPQGWINCGFADHSPPDIGPDDEFRSPLQPFDGQSFLVLVTRDNATWERVAGQLDHALSSSQAYRLEVALARSPAYFSRSPIVQQEINFAFPVRLRLWGALADCAAHELLAQTPPIEHTDWQTYTLEFEPMSPYTQLILEAYYATDADLPYPGNLAIDRLSAIIPISQVQTDLRELRLSAPPRMSSATATNSEQKPDPQRLRSLLDHIKPGQLEQGIYQLAVYQRSLRQPPWTIYLKQDGSKASRQLKRALKKQIAAMNLQNYLRVDDYISALQSMQWLCTPVDGGLGLKAE